MKLMSFHVGAFAGMSRGGPYDGHVACLRENQPLDDGHGFVRFRNGFGAYPNRWKDQSGVWQPAPYKGSDIDAAAVVRHVKALTDNLRVINTVAIQATPDGKPFDLWCVDYEGGESDELPSLGARLKGPRGSEWRRFLRLTMDLCTSQLGDRVGFYDLRSISRQRISQEPIAEEGKQFVCCYPFTPVPNMLEESVCARLWFPGSDVACVSARFDYSYLPASNPLRAEHGKPVPDEVLAAVLRAVKRRLGEDAVLAHWGEADSVTAAHQLQAEAGRIRSVWEGIK